MAENGRTKNPRDLLKKYDKEQFVNANELYYRLCKICDEYNDDHILLDVLRDEINNAPSIDVVHARWIRYEHGSGIYCSYCRQKRRYKDEHDNYCPNCGSIMDLKI